MEMEKRQSPALVSVMVKNLDEVKGIVVIRGVDLCNPEIRFPVASALMNCGEKPIADLVTV
jgi:hypothetical protein